MKAIGDVLKDQVAEAAKKNQRDFSKKSYKDLQSRVFSDPDVHAFFKKHKDELTRDGVYATFANIYEYWQQKDGHDKVLAGYVPKLFVEGHGVGIKYEATAEKVEEDRQRATQKRIELIDLPEKLRRVKLGDIDFNGRREALEGIARFFNNLKAGSPARGLYLSGDFGVGKTYIMAGVANESAGLGKKVIFLHMPTFISSLSSHFDDNSLQDEIHRVAYCDVLILDDIGAESLSPWSRDDVLGVILQARMDNDLPTFFTSNLDMDALEDHFAKTRNSDEPAKAKRLMQRVRYLAQEVQISGANHRFGNN